MTQNQNFDLYIKNTFPYKGLENISDNVFYLLAQRMRETADQKEQNDYMDSFKDFISYIAEHCYEVNNVIAISDITDKNRKLKIKECVLINTKNDEYREKAKSIIKENIVKNKWQIKPDKLKCLVMDIKC